MDDRIAITADELDDPVLIDLHVHEAPKTCEAVLEALPLTGKVVHGQVSGEEVFIAQEGPNRSLEIQPENWEFQPVPRDVGYWYNHWEDGPVLRKSDEPVSEIVFVYGRNVRIRKDAERISAINLFGEISDNFESFVPLCYQSRYEENPHLTVQKY